jgi:hypothetical protein
LSKFSEWYLKVLVPAPSSHHISSPHTGSIRNWLIRLCAFQLSRTVYFLPGYNGIARYL